MSNNPTPQEVKDLFRPIMREYNFSTMIRTIIFWALPVAMLAFIAMWYFQVPLMTFGLSLGLAYMSLGFFVLVVGLVLYFAADRQFKEWLRNYNYSQEFNGHILHAACRRGNKKILGLLLKVEDIEINKTDKYGDTPLTNACVNGHKDVVALLLKVEDIEINKTDKSGDTPLINACVNGHKDVVALLLKAEGIDVNHVGNGGSTALHIACFYGYKDVVALLLKVEDIEINKTCKYGNTPLIDACVNGYKDVVALLLKAEGIDVNHVDNKGNTALHIACFYGHKDVVELLLANGADITLTNKEGKTAKEIAREKNKEAIPDMACFYGQNVVVLPMANGADPTITNKQNDLPADVVSTYSSDRERILKALAGASKKRPDQPSSVEFKAGHAKDLRRNQGDDAKVPAADTGGSALPADEKAQKFCTQDRGGASLT